MQVPVALHIGNESPLYIRERTVVRDSHFRSPRLQVHLTLKFFHFSCESRFALAACLQVLIFDELHVVASSGVATICAGGPVGVVFVAA